MTVISITLIPSTTQLISGIPKTVTITTNIAAIIFYTLDGTDPTTSSTVYTTPIALPTNNPSVTLKVFATDGVNNSSILSVTYAPDLINARLPHSKVDIINQTGGNGCDVGGDLPQVLWTQPADSPMNAAGVANVDQDGYGYEPSVYPVREYDNPIPTYNFEYSETNWKGEIGADIGTLPTKATIIYLPPPPEQDTLNNSTYNPRALVTFHDGTKANANEDTIFRPYFEGEDYEKSMYGTKYSTTAAKDGEFAPNGSLLRYLYNPTENTITFYYFDSRNNRWIISKENVKSVPTNPNQQNALYNFISPSVGDGHVYRWMLYKYTTLI